MRSGFTYNEGLLNEKLFLIYSHIQSAGVLVFMFQIL